MRKLTHRKPGLQFRLQSQKANNSRREKLVQNLIGSLFLQKLKRFISHDGSISHFEGIQEGHSEISKLSHFVSLSNSMFSVRFSCIYKGWISFFMSFPWSRVAIQYFNFNKTLKIKMLLKTLYFHCFLWQVVKLSKPAKMLKTVS